MTNESNPAGVSAVHSESSEATSGNRTGEGIISAGESSRSGGDSAKSGGETRSPGESLDKVRDILFGSQSREYEKRFARLEERLIKEASDLREDLKKRFDTLELYIKREIESLTDRLKAEHDQRAESAKELSGAIKDTSLIFEKKTSLIDQQLSASQRELREQLLNQSKSLSDEIRDKHDKMTSSLERATAELRDEKTDRAALASLFMEVAMRLNNEFKIPRAEELE